MPVSEDELDLPGSKAEQRRSNKPIMEKRRRARINNSLDELKFLILEAMQKDPSRHSKLEKADILEMTVKHLQNIQRQQLAIAVASDQSVLHKFKTGFSECADEVSRYVGRLEEMEPNVKQRLVTHLISCVKSLQHVSTPFSANDPNNNGPRGIAVLSNRLPLGDSQSRLIPGPASADFISQIMDRSHTSAFTTVSGHHNILPPASPVSSISDDESTCSDQEITSVPLLQKPGSHPARDQAHLSLWNHSKSYSSFSAVQHGSQVLSFSYYPNQLNETSLNNSSYLTKHSNSVLQGKIAEVKLQLKAIPITSNKLQPSPSTHLRTSHKLTTNLPLPIKESISGRLHGCNNNANNTTTGQSSSTKSVLEYQANTEEFIPSNVNSRTSMVGHKRTYSSSTSSSDMKDESFDSSTSYSYSHTTPNKVAKHCLEASSQENSLKSGTSCKSLPSKSSKSNNDSKPSSSVSEVSASIRDMWRPW